MDSDEAPPPPYSAVDPLVAQTNNSRNASIAIAAEPRELPAHFLSAASYFAERPPPAVEHGEQILEHHMTIYPRSQSKDFPRRPRCWSLRMEHISQQDWDMFLRHLFPPHLGLASSSAQLPRQVRAEIQRDRKDRPQESDEQRESRITAVMLEWNQYFFEPRAARITFVHVADPRNAPLSPLCPRCYPAATRASQESRAASQTQETDSPNLSSPAAWNPNNPAYPAQIQVPYGVPSPPTGPGPYSPYPPQAFYNPGYPPHGYHYPSHYQNYNQWGWGSHQYPPQCESSSLKGGPLGWIAALAAQAQKYGERISEQAQQYGDQISAHAQHYGRQVEEHAMAHGRWFEEQASFQGRKVENAFSGWSAHAPPNQAYYQHNPTYAYANTESSSQPATSAPMQRARRDSVGSNASESSLSSIDSLSTTSDLSSSDLATVRAQLLSLNDHHERDLYEAAVELRRQLDALRDSRRQARISGRGHWGNGWGRHPRNHGNGRGSWGRWESPQDRQRNQAEKRAAKEEMRATRKAFKDVLRRAREERRENIRMKRIRQRQERRSRRGRDEEAFSPAPAPNLEQGFQNLTLDGSRESSSTVPSSTSVTSPVQSTTTSVTSPISSVCTLSPKSSNENKDTSAGGKDHDKE